MNANKRKLDSVVGRAVTQLIGYPSRRIPLAKSAKFAKRLQASQTLLCGLRVLGENNPDGSRGGSDQNFPANPDFRDFGSISADFWPSGAQIRGFAAVGPLRASAGRFFAFGEPFLRFSAVPKPFLIVPRPLRLVFRRFSPLQAPARRFSAPKCHFSFSSGRYSRENVRAQSSAREVGFMQKPTACIKPTSRLSRPPRQLSIP